MSTGRYKAYRSADAQFTNTGYRKAWLSLVADFTTLVEPVLTDPTPLIGEKFRIQTDHTWAAGKEAIPVYVQKDSIEAPGESAGEQGSVGMVYTPKVFIIGDGPVILEMVTNWLNEDMVLFVQDECSPDTFVQFGCKCDPVNVQKGSFASGTYKAGKKGYEMNFETKTKFFYEGDIDERA